MITTNNDSLRVKENTLNYTIKSFLQYMEVNGSPKSTIEAYETDGRCFKKYIEVYLGGRINYTYEITINIVEQYKTYLISKGCALKTVQRKYYSLRKYLNWLNNKETNIIQPQVINYIKADDFKKKWRNREQEYKVFQEKLIKQFNGNGKCEKINVKKSKALKYLSNDKIQEIIKNLNEDTSSVRLRNKVLVTILITTGIRRSEVLALTWDDISLTDESVHVKMIKSQKNGTLKLCNELADMLKQYKKESFYKYGDKLPRYVFPGKNISDMLSLTAYNNVIKKCTKGIEIENGFNITGHTFRHTFITNLIKENISIKDIVAYTKISERVLEDYTHLSEGDVEYVGEIINDLYFRNNSNNVCVVHKE